MGRKIIILAIVFFSMTLGTRLTFAKGHPDGIVRVKQYRSVMINCGDTIGSIASSMYSDDWTDTGSFIHEVMVINHLDDDEELIAGNFLTIPYYTDKPAE